MRIFIGIMMILLAGSMAPPLSGQGVESLNRRQQKQYDQIRSDNNRGALAEALEGLNRLLEDVPDFAEGRHLRGSIRYEQKEYEAAVEDLKAVLQLDPGYDPIVRYQLALANKALMAYEAAAADLEAFIGSGYRRSSVVERARAHLEDVRFAAAAVRDPVPFAPENIGAPISSRQPEYLPLLSADGNTLVFTRRAGDQEDFFIAEKKEGKWASVQPLSALNSPFNEGAQTISADGRLMVFTFCQSGPDQGGCNLFYAEKCDGSWSRPQPIEGETNTGAWEAQPSLSADGSLLLFASNRPGGAGGNDLWAVRRSRSGRWGKPVNLGPAINTAGNEQSPFLHADGRTLYFSSDGRPGMGDTDLYRVQLGEDGQWGEVTNLGYPINTPEHEGALSLSLDGRTGFFAKSPGGPADLDIFTFTVPESLRPFPVTYVKGKVFDSATGEALSARIELTDLTTGRLVAIIENCEDGSYLMCLPAGKAYALNVNKPGYLFFSEHFDLAAADLSQPFQLDAALQPLVEANETIAETPPKRQPVILKNVFFATGSAELLPASTDELDRLLRLLEDNAGLRIRINGHTDDVGSEEDNLRLSRDRAEAVYDYLLEKGIDAERLRFKGFGETEPIAANDTPEGRQQNRRTEFEVW